MGNKRGRFRAEDWVEADVPTPRVDSSFILPLFTLLKEELSARAHLGGLNMRSISSGTQSEHIFSRSLVLRAYHALSSSRVGDDLSE
jgi:hypothetical protein